MSLGSWSSELILDLMHFGGWENRFRYEKSNVRALFFANPRGRRLGESMRSHCVLLMMVVGDLVGKARVHRLQLSIGMKRTELLSPPSFTE